MMYLVTIVFSSLSRHEAASGRFEMTGDGGARVRVLVPVLWFRLRSKCREFKVGRRRKDSV